MVDAPCSRIGHIYRKFAPFLNPGVGDFVGRVGVKAKYIIQLMTQYTYANFENIKLHKGVIKGISFHFHLIVLVIFH